MITGKSERFDTLDLMPHFQKLSLLSKVGKGLLC